MYEFSLRFYGQTQENVDKCVAEMKAINPDIKGHTDAPIIGMNLGITPSHCIYLLFDNEMIAAKMMRNQPVIGIYQKYMNATEHAGTFERRKVGQPAWRI